MNKIEHLIYDIVKSNPRLKIAIRNLYQGLFDLLPRKKTSSKNIILVKENCFFGFHEIQPFSTDNSKILANRLRYREVRMPKENDYIDVGYIIFEGEFLGDFVIVGETNAWNFHKGCRLQWIDESKIIFNCTHNGVLCSKIVDIDLKKEKIIPYPIDTVSKNGMFATSFSYERLEKYMPGYGYAHNDNYSYINVKTTDKTGLYLIDLTTKERKLIVDLKKMSDRTSSFEASKESYHFVTHSEFSHDSKYISFLHRWTDGFKSKLFTELMIYEIESGKVLRIPTTNHMTSHYDWNNKHEIIAYCNYKNQDAHVLLKINDIKNSHHVAHPRVNSDGHQSFINDTSFVTDTYPDKWRISRLYSVDINTNTAKVIASVQSYKKYQSTKKKGNIACDLHPRVSRDGKYVCFDTVHTGVRGLAVMKL